jgi:hypothetical protein
MKRTSVWTLVVVVLLPWMSGPAGGQSKEESQPFDLTAVRVHAIAWAADPAERIAAVDDRILREGMTHRGATIVEIRPRSVVFDFAGRKMEG